MANWVLVENNTILEYHDTLPRAWKNISSLDKAPYDWLLSKGWYRVQKKSQAFDSANQKVIGYIYAIKTDFVEESMNIVDLSPQEIQELNYQKQHEFFSALRYNRNKLLAECDWTQVSDIQEIKSPEWVQSWKLYRQELRDLPDKYKTSNSFDLADVSWPILPDE